MSRLIEVYVEDNVVKGSILDGIFFENTLDLISYMESHYEI